MATDWKATLNLPRTDFPMKADLVQREPQRVHAWEKNNLYARIQVKNSGKQRFVLHDGPPFTNGDVHIGTALNKILKDTVVRYRSMNGCDAPFVPGWDCHGLPIEHKVTKLLREKGQFLEAVDLRDACAEFSRGYIEKQRGQFKRLGVLADWEQEYRTMNPAYEADVLRWLATCVEKGYVYRSKKPVYWSIPCETALAEAEIEYQDHTSTALWVKFFITEPEKIGLTGPAYVVIWTTTPWTLPANLAIAVHPDADYTVVSVDDEHYLVAKDLAETFVADCKLSNAAIEAVTFKGAQLEHLKTQHPFVDRKSPIVLANYVTMDSGTGCVHTAPGHGLEDFLTGCKYSLRAYCPLDDQGCYVDDGEMPKALVGVTVLETNGVCPANDAVINMLKSQDALLHTAPYAHSYPHCWRSKTPVIFRAMDQWFIKIDDPLRKEALDTVSQVAWTPSWGENRIRGALEARPDWCISRQRAWGIPLPSFIDETGTSLIDANVIRGLADKIEHEGTQLWFKQSAEQLLCGIDLPENWHGKRFVKGKDTLDVWIDSGCSHLAVLAQSKWLQWPADLYLEGSDQHRGWFQSSLWTSMIATGKPPYKSVVTHGFVVDENKKKISKSDGKPQTADDYIQKYGADVVRLWIASEDYRNDIPISDGILQHISGTYRTIRNTLRFLLGNLYDFDASKDRVCVDQMLAIDRWALHNVNLLIDQVTAAYESYEFHKVYQLLNKFCCVTLSATYHDILKDRLYTSAPDWLERRSAQTALYGIFQTLVRFLAPILTFTADEAYACFTVAHGGAEDDSIHLQDWPTTRLEWHAPEIYADIEALLKFKANVNEKLEALRQAKTIGQSLDAQVIITIGAAQDLSEALRRYANDLAELFIVSQVVVRHVAGAQCAIEVKHADGVRCPRSWKWVPALVEVDGMGQVAPKCREALKR